MSIKHRIKYSAVTLMLVLSSVLLSTPFTGGGRQSLANIDPVLLRDAEIYAKSEGVTVEEALHRFHLIEIAGPLHSELYSMEAATFGDGWIENGQNFKFVFQFTENGEETMKPYLAKYPELADYIEVRQAKIPYRQLVEQQRHVISDIQKAGIPADFDADIRTGNVRVYTVDRQRIDNAMTDGTLILPDNVDIATVGALSQKTVIMKGGHNIKGSYLGQYYIATTGFGVSGYGYRYITTAGHFAQLTWDQAYYDDFYPQLTGVGYRNDGWGRTDAAYYVDVSQQHGVTNVIWDGYSERGIGAIEDYSAIFVGEFVFKYGRTTGNTSGQVTSKNWNGSFIMTNAAVAGGDSGGPVFRSYIAIGDVVGEYGGQMYFGAVSFWPSDLGVTVLTAP